VKKALLVAAMMLLVPAAPAMAQSEFNVTSAVEEELPVLLPTPQGESTYYVCLDGTWGQVQIVETRCGYVTPEWAIDHWEWILQSWFT
jgi:hypothetical protein